MEVVIQPDAYAAAQLTARIIARRLEAKPNLTLGLATGRTMERVYDCLAEIHAKDSLDFSLCRTFNLDEYVGLKPDDPHSYRYYMTQHLFSRVNIDPRNTHLPNGMADDLDRECRDYDGLIKESNGIDLQLLGIGVAGHIGFNEPLSALYSRTREKALTPMTLKQNAGMFDDDPDKVPKRALTMGIGTILEAREVLMLVTGETKAEILAKAIEGPITSMVSATALQMHQSCKVIVDEEAAELLQCKDYYRWIFDNEPEWQEFR
jgi:glucosamine-6-phosphate deaminase